MSDQAFKRGIDVNQEDAQKQQAQMFDELFEYSSELMFQNLANFFNIMAKKLHTLQNESSDSEIRNQYSKSIFEKQVQVFLNVFHKRWLQSFEKLRELQENDEADPTSRLSLVDHDIVEQDIERRKFINQFKQEQGSVVDSLIIGLSNSIHTRDLIESEIPFLPEGLAACMLQAFQEAEFCKAIDKLIKKELSTSFYPKVSGLYYSTQKHFENRGISLTEINFQPITAQASTDSKKEEDEIIVDDLIELEFDESLLPLDSESDQHTEATLDSIAEPECINEEPSIGDQEGATGSDNTPPTETLSTPNEPHLTPQHYASAPQQQHTNQLQPHHHQPSINGESMSFMDRLRSAISEQHNSAHNGSLGTVEPHNYNYTQAPGIAQHLQANMFPNNHTGVTPQTGMRYDTTPVPSTSSEAVATETATTETIRTSTNIPPSEFVPGVPCPTGMVSHQQFEQMLSMIDINALNSTEQLNDTISQSIARFTQNASDIDQSSLDYLSASQMFFKIIQQDREFIPEVSQQLTKLQVAFMRMLMLDQGVFDQKDHPARHLLNDWINIAETVNSTDSESFKVLTTISDSLSQAEFLDVEQVKTEQFNLHHYMNDAIQSASQAHEEQAKREEERLQKLAAQEAEAKEIIEKHIHFPLSQLQELLPIHQLMEDIWSSLIKQMINNDDKSSADTQFCINLFTRTLWSINSGKDDVTRDKLLRQLPVLLKGLANAFCETDIEPAILKSFIDQLQEKHEEILSKQSDSSNSATDNDINTGTLSTHRTSHEETKKIIDQLKERRKQAEKEKASLVDVDHDVSRTNAEPTKEPKIGHHSADDPAAIHAKPTSTSEYKQAIETLLSVGTGSWLKYRVDNGYKRCKVTFYSPSLEKYTFVDQMGQKLFDRKRADLLKDIQLGFANIIENFDLFDETLESVIATVQAERAA